MDSYRQPWSRASIAAVSATGIGSPWIKRLVSSFPGCTLWKGFVLPPIRHKARALGEGSKVRGGKLYVEWPRLEVTYLK